MREPDFEYDRTQSVEWAKMVLPQRDIVILDTKMTGLSNPEIVQIAIIDLSGKLLLDSLVKPIYAITPGAIAIHGITDHLLVEAPTFLEIYPIILEVVKNKEILIYNANFDLEAMQNCCRISKLEPFPLTLYKGITCVMQWYSQYCGSWNEYYSNYRWQKLPAGDHSALGDCLATLKVIKRMAGKNND